MEAVRRFQDLAEAKGIPTKVVVKIPRNSKTHIFVVPAATKGYSGGRPEFPVFGAVGRSLYIAPDYPRKGSVNIREVVGQYIGAYLARTMAHVKEGVSFTASDVGVEVARKRGRKRVVENESDVDLFHIRTVALMGSEHYELIPVEVTTSAERMAHKIEMWKNVAKLFEKLAKNEGKTLIVKPIVIHVKTPGNREKNCEKSIEGLLKRHFDAHHLVTINSNSKAEGKYIEVQGEYGSVEYIAAALKNIAKLPEAYHTDLTSAVIKKYKDIGALRQMFHETAMIRKIWRARSIPEAVKRYITDRYAEHVTAEREDALMRALKEAEERFKEHARAIKRKKQELLLNIGKEY